MSKESVQGLARRQRRNVVGDWLLGAFVSGLLVLMLGGIATSGGITAEDRSTRADTAASTPAQLVQQHTERYCGDVPPLTPVKGEAPTC